MISSKTPLQSAIPYFKEQKRADEIVQQRREEIEAELPRFVNTIEQELRASRDVLNILKSYPDIPAVYVDTGLEYPELRDFVKTKDNVIWLRPRYPFTQILEKYGYPIISKEVSDVINGARKGQPYHL